MFFRYMNNSEEIKSLKFKQIMELIKSDNLYSDETQVMNHFLFMMLPSYLFYLILN